MTVSESWLILMAVFGLGLIGCRVAQPAPSGPEADEAAQPTLATVDLKLVVVQAPMRVDADFMEDMRALWRKLAARLDDIEHQSEPRRQIGHWHWVDAATRVYVMGVQVDTLEGFQWDYDYGLGAWAPGEMTVAKFRERNGEEGSVVRTAYGTLAEMGYGHDPRFMGEFEVWPLDSIGPDGEKPGDEYHEVWIPVVKEADRAGADPATAQDKEAL